MNNKSTISIFIFSALFLISFFIISDLVFCKDNIEESFVVKKKKKGQSKSKWQENICEVFGSQMSCAPSIHKKIAEIQEILLKQTYKYLENAKDGFIVKAKKDKRSEVLKVAKDFENKMGEFCKECDKFFDYLNGLT